MVFSAGGQLISKMVVGEQIFWRLLPMGIVPLIMTIPGIECFCYLRAEIGAVPRYACQFHYSGGCYIGVERMIFYYTKMQIEDYYEWLIEICCET